MMAAISLLLLLFSMCVAQAGSTLTEAQTESQSTGAAAAAAAAEVSTQLDVFAELKELRGELQAVKSKLYKMETENVAQNVELTALKTQLATSEAEVLNLRRELADLRSVVERLEATESKMDLVTVKTEMDNLRSDNAAQETELTALKTRLAATEAEVVNLEKELKSTPKVAFSAALTNTGFIQAGDEDLDLVFTKVISNVGQAYSSTTGFFTAPARGVYYFRFTVRDFLKFNGMGIGILTNGRKVMYLNEYDIDGQSTYLSSGVTLQLEVGDIVNMKIPGGLRLYDDLNNHSTFSGFLLFPL
ncbi:hypothetical protein ACEWY4_022918 [Coilia grayii]|uniref:C1q domain-containing protein n=1 Tax=Coilia grayii TaxID=363190 RepID=A0ABD1J1I4_9TELE